MAKQFALHHGADERSAIDGHELPARRCIIQGPRGHLFARAAFPLNQDGGAANPELLDLAPKLDDSG